MSRIETARQRISLDQLASITEAFGVSIDTVISSHSADHTVTRPQHHPKLGFTVWPLNSGDGHPETVVAKILLTRSIPIGDPDALRVHPGNEWFLVLSGTVQLLLDTTSHAIDSGDAVSFSTMVPHAVGAVDGPAEILMVLDQNGDRTHLDLRTEAE